MFSTFTARVIRTPHLLAAPLAVALLGCAAFAAAAPATPPPNFVVIMAEAQGWPNTSVQMDDRLPASRSATVRTPALERLAREGMRFAYGYALSPRCTPSRAALFTGRNPAELRMTYVGVGRDSGTPRTKLIPPEPVLELPASAITVAELLQPLGYTAAHFGKWHVGRTDPARHGFDASDGPTSNGGPDNVANPNPQQAPGMTERGIAFITAAARAGRPFYLQLSHYPDQERRENTRGRDGNGDAGDLVDRVTAQLLDALDRLGLAANTYVFYTADHGGQGRNGNAPLAGGKGSVLEGGLRVPFLVRGPGIPANVCSRVPVTACDILPTLAALAGARDPLPAGVAGGSLLPVLRDPTGRGTVARPRAELVFHFPHYDLGNGGPATALLLGQHKLVRHYETGKQRLVDLATDPGEQHDLAPTHPELAADLAGRLDAYLRAVNADLARPNPDYDPSRAPSPDAPENRDDRRGRKGNAKGSPDGKRRPAP